jgi:protein-S-isoprenylcysteine O-methyltransferase Ste14
MSPVSDSSQQPDLQRVQRLRKHALRLGLAICAGLLLVTESAWRDPNPNVYRSIVLAGVALIVICIAGRTWCTLYIGGLKKKQLIVLGPYSIVRNPLYVFTILGAVGIGAQAGSITMTLLFAIVVAAVFYAVALREQTFLATAFGGDYAAYAQRVPLFVPRLSLWQDAEQLTVNSDLVRMTFRDALWFLLAIPASPLLAWLHDSGALPVWLRLL